MYSARSVALSVLLLRYVFTLPLAVHTSAAVDTVDLAQIIHRNNELQ
jgi:hypothetical protein